MKKIIVISLCIMIIMIPCLVFASYGSPIILPSGDSYSNAMTINFSNGASRSYIAISDSPVYLVFANVGGSDSLLVFSDTQSSSVLAYYNDTSFYTYSLTDEYNGFYFSINNFQYPVNDLPYYYDGEFTSYSDLIDSINNSVFSTSFDLTYLVNGSISWLSTFAQAVKNNVLLLFFVMFIFVGIGIGLMRRFTRR